MNSFFKEYLANIIPVSFALKMDGNEQRIGEAYMRGDIEVDRDLYEVLDLFLGEIYNG